MACPHVAGAVALLHAENAHMTPSDVIKTLQENAATNYVERLSPMDQHNKLLYVGNDRPEKKSERVQIDWPTPAFFDSCSKKGPTNRGPLESNGNCQCMPGTDTICYNGKEPGCPITADP